MLRYETRNNALTKPTTYVLEGDDLLIEVADQAPRRIALKDIASARLGFAPTRVEANRFRCTLTLKSGATIDFYNRSYRGVMDFSDTSVEYVAFVKALHDALARLGSACRFEAGQGSGNYYFGGCSLVFVVLAVIGAGIFFVAVGLVWIALIKVVIIAFYIPTAIRWMKRNKPRTYPVSEIPEECLPGK